MNVLNLNAIKIHNQASEQFRGKTFAYAVVAKGGRDWQLGIVVKNEAGYHPIEGLFWRQRDDAQKWVDDLNRYIGLSVDDAALITLSTMRKTRR